MIKVWALCCKVHYKPDYGKKVSNKNIKLKRAFHCKAQDTCGTMPRINPAPDYWV